MEPDSTLPTTRVFYFGATARQDNVVFRRILMQHPYASRQRATGAKGRDGTKPRVGFPMSSMRGTGGS